MLFSDEGGDLGDPSLHPDGRWREKVNMLRARNQPQHSASWNPDPGKSVLCQSCRVSMNNIQSHPWTDPGRAKLAIGETSETSETIGLASWEGVTNVKKNAYTCALCSIVEAIIAQYRTSASDPVLVDNSSYRLKPRLFGKAIDQDLRRVIGQATLPGRRQFDRWLIGVELRPPGRRSSPIMLSDAILAAIRPLPTPFYLCLEVGRQIEQAPFETRSLLHGRGRAPQCDFDLLKGWFSLCSTRHGQQCAPRARLRGSTRLIDTKMNCLVRSDAVDSDCTYVALSYVWGNKEQRYAPSADDYSALFVEDALLNLRLSKTIADAMCLVRELGLRYLWVDALCIRQDDTSDKHEQIAQMGFVYESALFTIIAAAGEDCDSGLPGVRVGSRLSVQKKAEAGNIILLNTFRSSTSTTKWARRAWTYQEELLSMRRLIFTPDVVSWNCACASWFEDSQLESRDSMGFMPLGATLRPRLETKYETLLPGEYFELVERYATRELSYPSDALNAFSGILSMLTEYSGEQFLWGHMRSAFERQLFWFGTAKARDLTGTDKLPSWSWVSREGALSFSYHNMYRPRICCYVLEAGETGIMCSPVSQASTSGFDNSKIEVSIDDIEQIMPASQLIPGFHLCFYAEKASFYLMPQGHLILPNAPATFWRNGQTFPRPTRGYLLPSLHGNQLAVKGYRECILIGERPATSSYDDAYVLVMLIKRNASGIAYREGIAVIPAERWEMADKARELVVLA